MIAVFVITFAFLTVWAIATLTIVAVVVLLAGMLDRIIDEEQAPIGSRAELISGRALADAICKIDDAIAGAPLLCPCDDVCECTRDVLLHGTKEERDRALSVFL